jgi:predicted acetyltransferase
LRLLLPEIRGRLPYIEITTEPDNVASQKVVTANGGTLIEEFEKPASLGGGKGLRYRIMLETR